MATKIAMVLATSVTLLTVEAKPASASGITVVAETGGQVLFIRAQPNQTNAPIGSFNDGATVRVDCYITSGQFIVGPTASSSVWHRLNGRAGWVSGVYLRGGGFGGVAGEPRCASGGGPYAFPRTYKARNACGLADITFTTGSQTMSVNMRTDKINTIVKSGYKCLADAVIVNWVNPSAAAKWKTYLRNEIRNHAFAYNAVPIAKVRNRANPAGLDLLAYPHLSKKSVEWRVDWYASSIGSTVVAAWILL